MASKTNQKRTGRQGLWRPAQSEEESQRFLSLQLPICHPLDGRAAGWDVQEGKEARDAAETRSRVIILDLD